MATPLPQLGWSQRFQHGLKRHRALVSYLVLIVGLVLTSLSIADFTPLGAIWPFSSINAATDQSSTGGENWNLVFAIVGPIILIIGAYLVGVYSVARHRFEELMRSRSKAEFLRTIPEIEEILGDLTPEDSVRYESKLSELRIRR